MSAAAARKQDMPPAGGYKQIPYLRVPPKSYFSGFQIFVGVTASTVLGIVVYTITARQIKRNEIEMRSAQNVMMPLLLAERDREFLKQLRRNRDEEEKLMAKVPGWEVGTWYGEPIFKTLPKDKLVSPTFHEFYAQADFKSFAKRAFIKLWT